MNKSTFIEKSSKRHQKRYDYSLIPENFNSHNKVIVIDKENNIKFIQIAIDHYCVGYEPTKPLNQDEANK